MGQLPDGGGGFSALSFCLSENRFFVHSLQVFFLPARLVLKCGNSSIGLHVLQFLHTFSCLKFSYPISI